MKVTEDYQLPTSMGLRKSAQVAHGEKAKMLNRTRPQGPSTDKIIAQKRRPKRVCAQQHKPVEPTIDYSGDDVFVLASNVNVFSEDELKMIGEIEAERNEAEQDFTEEELKVFDEFEAGRNTAYELVLDCELVDGDEQE